MNRDELVDLIMGLVRGPDNDIKTETGSVMSKDDDVDISHFKKTVYEWKSKLAEVNDAFNPALRQLRPKRQRPEHGRYDNYWRARMTMETLADAMEPHESGMGGKLQSRKLFKRLDLDNDGMGGKLQSRKLFKRLDL